jgi:hypothetical protein
MALWLNSTWSSLIASGTKPAPHSMRGAGFGALVQLTLARQSETVGSTTGLGGRDEADQDGGNWAGFCRGGFAAHGSSRCANRTVRSADSAGVTTRRGPWASPGSTVAPTRADLSAQQPAGTGWCLSALLPGPKCGARMHGNLCAGISAERHGDRAPHELLLARRLAARHPSALWLRSRIARPTFICAVLCSFHVHVVHIACDRRCRAA